MSAVTHTNPYLFQPSQLAAVLSQVLASPERDALPAALRSQATDALAQHQLALSDRFMLRDADNNETADATGALTCYDRQTHLTWQLASSSKRYAHEAAATYAAGLTTGGHTDWRLPNILELESIRDLSVFSPAVAAPFRETVNPNWHWSSSVDPDDEDYARVVDFDGGVSYIDYRDVVAYVLAVRGGGPVAGSVPGQ